VIVAAIAGALIYRNPFRRSRATAAAA
jgi:hypothetical protein